MIEPADPATSLPPRSAAESRVVMSQIMLPSDANPTGNVHGGVIMKLVDSAAGVAAIRHVRGQVVTARIDSMSFLQPVHVGDLVTIKASVNAVGRTSLEVGVRVEAEDLMSGAVRHVSSAYLVFVALDPRGKPAPVPALLAATPEERRRLAEAGQRRAHRQRGEEAMLAMRGDGRGPASDPLRRLRSWRKPGAPCVVVGHRGAAGSAPENTLPAFDLAVSQGVDAIETDVYLTKDGVAVAIHDATVDRTTNGHGAVADLSVAEIQALDARHRFRAGYVDARVPTLAEVLAWARGRTRVVVELKGTNNPELVSRTLALLHEHQMIDDVLLISFDHPALRRAAALCPGVLTGPLYVGRLADPTAVARAADAQVLCPQWSSIEPADVATVHAANLGVSVWTCDERPEIQRALAAGVDAISSNFPDRVIAITAAQSNETC